MADLSRLNESEACQEELIKIKSEEKVYLLDVLNKLNEKNSIIESKIKEKMKLVQNIKNKTDDKEIDDDFSKIDEEISDLKLKLKQNTDITIEINQLHTEIRSASEKL